MYRLNRYEALCSSESLSKEDRTKTKRYTHINLAQILNGDLWQTAASVWGVGDMQTEACIQWLGQDRKKKQGFYRKTGVCLKTKSVQSMSW